MNAFPFFSWRTWLVGGAALWTMTVAEAAIHTWDGGGATANWSDGNNWDFGSPGDGDQLRFPVGAARRTNFNDQAASVAYSSIRFLGSNYLVQGNALRVTNGLTAEYVSGTVTLDQDVTFSRDQSLQVDLPSARLVFNGALLISNSTSLRLRVAGTLRALGGIAGPNTAIGITKELAGLVDVQGVITFTNTITIEDGTFRVNNLANGTPFVVNGGVLGGDGSVASVTLNNGGELEPGDGAPGTFTIRSNLTAAAGATMRFRLNGTTAGSQYAQLSFPNSPSAVNLASATLDILVGYSPVVGDAFTIIGKAGTTNVAGTFSGLPEGAVFTRDDVTFRITYTGGSGNDVVVTVLGATSIWSGTGGPPGWSNPANWEGSRLPRSGYGLTFPATAANRTMLNDLALTNYNRVTFSGSNYVLTGTLPVLTNGITGSFPFGTNVLAAGVILNEDQVFSNAVAGTMLAVPTVILYSNALRLDGAGNFLTTQIVLSTNTVTKAGSGTWVMAGTNTYTGLTRLLGGTNDMRNSDFAASAGLVISNALLTGTGRVSGVTMLNNARLEPGGSAGRITIAGNLLATNGSIEFELNGLTPATQHDQLVVNGAVTLGAGLSVSLGFSAAVGDSFVIIDNDGADPVTGQFFLHPEGTEFTLGTNRMNITYFGGDGNDVVLTVAPFVRVWDGSDAAGFWTVANNWVGSLVPEPDADLLFPALASAADRLLTNDFPANTRFSSLMFSNSAYTLRGNALDLRDGLEAQFFGSATIETPLRLTFGQAWRLTNGNLTVNGPVNLNGNAVRLIGGSPPVGSPGGSVTSSGGFTGSGALTVSDPVTLTLNGTNTLSGPITNRATDLTLNGLLLNSSLFATGATLTIGAGALLSNTPLTVVTSTIFADGTFLRSALLATNCTLQGTGRLGTVTMSGGRLEPRTAAQPGVLACSNLVLSATTVVNINTSTNATPGTGHDQIKVTGTVNLAGATLVPGTVMPTAGAQLVIVDNDGADAVTGTFAGLPEGHVFNLGLATVHITYIGGTGNDVVIVIDSVITAGVWTGLAADDFWSSATNWSGSTVPSTNDHVFFPEGALQKTNRNTQTRTFRSLTFGGGGYVLNALSLGIPVRVEDGLFATNASGSNVIQFPVQATAVGTVISNTAGNLLHLANVQPGGVSTNLLPAFHPAGTIHVGILSGDETLVKRGPGLLTISFGSHLSNQVQAGTLRAASASGLGFPGSSVAISNGATVELGAGTYANAFRVAGTLLAAGTNTTVTAALTMVDTNGVLSAVSNAAFNFQSSLNATGASRLQCNVATNAVLTVLGAINTTNGFLMDGDGATVFRGVKNYSGLTRVNGGSLFIEGLSSNSVVEVNDNGAMSGFGIVGPLTCNSGFIAPGSPTTNAVLTAAEGVNFGPLGALRVRLNNSAITNYDRLMVSGPVVLGSPKLHTTLGYPLPVGSSFQVISNDGADAVIGTFAGIPQNGFHTNGLVVFRVSYNGGSGNDVALTVSHYNSNAVPRVWTGAGANNLWSTPQNWQGNVAPAPGDPLVFPVGAARLFNQNDFPSNTVFHSITFHAAGYRLSGNAVTLIADVQALQVNGPAIVALPLILTTRQSLRCANAEAALTLEGIIDSNEGTGVFDGAGTIFVSSRLVGAGHFEKRGTGVTEFLGTNTYTGSTQVEGGRLVCRNSTPGANNGSLLLVTNATLELLGAGSLNKGFVVGGTVLVSNAAPVVWGGSLRFPTNAVGTLNIATGTVVQTQLALDPSPGALIKEGPGTLHMREFTIPFCCTFKPVHRGLTMVNAGRLIQESTPGEVQFGYSNVVLNGDSELVTVGDMQGIQSIAGSIRLNLGAAPGQVRTFGSVSLSAATRLDVQLNGVQPGTEHDNLTVQGSVALNGAVLGVGIGFSPVIGTPFIIISNDASDAVVGTFAGLPEGATFAASNLFLRVSYVGGDGNDVVLTRVPPPAALLPLVCLPDGTKQLRAQGQPGVLYLITATNNVAAPAPWPVIGADVSDGAGLIEFTDTAATNFPIRFYRLESP